MRGARLKMSLGGPTGRATAFEFEGQDGRATWIGVFRLPADAQTGVHHHGRHEVAIFVAKGRGRIRWGTRLEFAAEIAPGDFVYFAPYVPHHEQNLDPADTLDFIVVRSDNEKISVSVDAVPVEHPEMVY